MLQMDGRSLLLCAAMLDRYSIRCFEALTPREEDYTSALVESLLRDGILQKGEDTAVLGEEAALCVWAACAPDACLCFTETAEGAVQKRVVYLYGETIVWLENTREDLYTLTWLPFLPLAIGAYAAYLGDFAGDEAVALGAFPRAGDPEDDGVTEGWIQTLGDARDRETLRAPSRRIRIDGWDCAGKDLSMRLLKREDHAVLLDLGETETAVSRVSKQDCVNALTGWLAAAFGATLERRVEVHV